MEYRVPAKGQCLRSSHKTKVVQKFFIYENISGMLFTSFRTKNKCIRTAMGKTTFRHKKMVTL